MVHGKHDPRLSNKYKKQRLVVLARDGYTCVYCGQDATCLLYTSPSPRDRQKSRMPSSA